MVLWRRTGWQQQRQQRQHQRRHRRPAAAEATMRSSSSPPKCLSAKTVGGRWGGELFVGGGSGPKLNSAPSRAARRIPITKCPSDSHLKPALRSIWGQRGASCGCEPCLGLAISRPQICGLNLEPASQPAESVVRRRPETAQTETIWPCPAGEASGRRPRPIV